MEDFIQGIEKRALPFICQEARWQGKLAMPPNLLLTGIPSSELGVHERLKTPPTFHYKPP